MNKAIALALLIATATLAGCATSHPEDRPYSAEEQHELALEALSRRGLSFDEYQREHARIERAQVHEVVGQQASSIKASGEGA